MASAGPCCPAGLSQLGPFLFPAFLPPPTFFLSAILSSPLLRPYGPILWPALLTPKVLTGPVPLGLLGKAWGGDLCSLWLFRAQVVLEQEEQLVGAQIGPVLIALCDAGSFRQDHGS